MSFLEQVQYIVFLGSILSIVCAILGQQCFDDGNEFCIDENDILSVDLLPGSFLFPDQQTARNTSTVSENKIVDGSINEALNNMEFHRQKMNEYLCHGYMAMEIVKLMSTPRVKRRLGTSENNELRDLVDDDNVTVHDKLLADEGSLKYKNWLQRRTTLDDVYRHYIPHKKMGKIHGSRDDNIEDFDGEVTGYAMQAPLPSGKVGFYEGHDGDDDPMISSASGHNFYSYGHSYGHGGGDPYNHHSEIYPAVHEEHYYPPTHYHEHEEEYHKPYYYKSKGSDLSIRDFFEIALTALAFLAFGLFIIQLLMNMTNTMNMTMPTVVTTNRRSKRNVAGLPFFYNSNEDLNELSYNVLRSIEGALVADLDSGNCLRRILCEGNRRSTQMDDARKIWVPVWRSVNPKRRTHIQGGNYKAFTDEYLQKYSLHKKIFQMKVVQYRGEYHVMELLFFPVDTPSLGMSWVSGRVINGSPWTAMLDSLKASILGLGRADCTSLYPDCNLKKERNKRLKRRRK